MAKELSIFIDESGDFGEYNFHSPYYIVTLVLHNQENNITNNIKILDNKLKMIGYDKNWIHVGPIIRKEEDYCNMDVIERRKILNAFVAFVKKCKIKYECFYIEKKHIIDEVEASTKLTKQISTFIKDNLEYFNSFETIKIYYDNGQIEVTKMFSNIFNTLFTNVIINKVIPSKYKLFQVADLYCYFKLLSLKIVNKSITKNELYFFDNIVNIRKNYLHHLQKLKFSKYH